MGDGKGVTPHPPTTTTPSRDEQVRQEIEQERQNRERVDPEAVRRNLEALNSSLAARSLDLRFGVYNDTHQLYVQVVSIARGEVLKTLPMEKLLRLRETLETAMGLFLDETR